MHLIRHKFAEGELTRLCGQSIDRAKTGLDAIGALSGKARTFDAAVLEFDTILTDMSDETSPLIFMSSVSPSEKLNAEASACEEKVGQFMVSVFTRKDLYTALKAPKPRNKDERRLRGELLKGFEDNGLMLSDAKLAQMIELRKKLTTLETQFGNNLNLDKSSVEFTAEELKGVPESAMSRFKKSEDGERYVVTTKSTDYVAVMENASNSETRKRLQFAYWNRAADKNLALLEEALQLRQQIAKLMGFKTWADFRINRLMAKKAPTVRSFLTGLRAKLSKRQKQDLAKLLAYKKELDPTATTLNSWDPNYLAYQLKKRDYALDDEQIREYFPGDRVIQGMFEIYSQLLGVDYVEVKGADTWFEGVKLYEIREKGSPQAIAYFYTDFYPRQGKYGHAAAFTLISGRKTADGYSKPVSAIVANFTPPNDGKPSLLTHDEVETIFHEFGHIMHQTLTRAPYGSLSGTSVPRDFVEAPSQMLENWVWTKEMLAKISGHYKDQSKPLPPDLLDRMLAAEDFNQGYAYMVQLYYGTLDMTFHTTSGPVNTNQIREKLFEDMMRIKPLQGTAFQASFGHLMGGYDSGYYGYLWSKVYAYDMFSKFQKAGLLDSKTGMRYRKLILEQGNMRDTMDLLVEFLGRAPSNKAFFKKLGI